MQQIKERVACCMAGRQAYDIVQKRHMSTSDKGNTSECIQSPIIRASTRNACYDSRAERFF